MNNHRQKSFSVQDGDDDYGNEDDGTMLVSSMPVSANTLPADVCTFYVLQYQDIYRNVYMQIMHVTVQNGIYGNLRLP